MGARGAQASPPPPPRWAPWYEERGKWKDKREEEGEKEDEVHPSLATSISLSRCHTHLKTK
jgi:hypothetical protein